MTDNDADRIQQQCLPPEEWLWARLAQTLGAYVAEMDDPAETDHLLLEVAERGGAEGDGCAPYVQFAAFGDGEMVRAEISGDAYLSADWALGESGAAYLRAAGWEGNTAGEPNWFRHLRLTEAASAAGQVVTVLREHFGLPHPELLTYQAWGPASVYVDQLGLLATDDVPSDSAEVTATRVIPPKPQPAYAVDTPEELVAHVARALKRACDEEPVVDGDGDFVVSMADDIVWVRIHGEAEAVEIATRVVSGVHSRCDAAVETAVLNRNHLWGRWQLRGDSVWLSIVIPANPFAPGHLAVMLEVFEGLLVHTRDDLALRLRADLG